MKPPLPISAAVSGAGIPAIDTTQPWRERHLRAIEQAYAKAPQLGRYRDALAAFYRQDWDRLARLAMASSRWLAGALGVPAKTFTLWQVAGGLLWSLGVTLAGYVLGSRIPSIDTYLLPIIAVIVLLSLIPVARELLRARRHAKESRDS